jgi:hypothetical protein
MAEMINTPGPESVWAILQEVAESLKETGRQMKETDRRMKETDRKMKEMRKEADERWQKLEAQFKRTDRQLKRTNKQLGGLHNSFGELMETLMRQAKFQSPPYSYGFDRAYMRLSVFKPGDTRRLFEIDILLSSSDIPVEGSKKGFVMAVEVKSKVEKADIARHVERMKTIIKYPPEMAIGRKVLGAMASGVSLSAEERAIVHEAGFFLLELKGEAVELVRPPEGFEPMECCNSLSENC